MIKTMKNNGSLILLMFIAAIFFTRIESRNVVAWTWHPRSNIPDVVSEPGAGHVVNPDPKSDEEHNHVHDSGPSPGAGH
ncbi:hypothetical protein OROGR_028627 [Orobanche gracilis]